MIYKYIIEDLYFFYSDFHHIIRLTSFTDCSNIDGVLNKFKSKINTVEDNLPQSSYVVADDDVRADRPFMLKMRKGSNLHRFKIKTVGVNLLWM